VIFDGRQEDGRFHLIAQTSIISNGIAKEVSISRAETQFINFNDLSLLDSCQIEIETGGRYGYKGIAQNNRIELTELKYLGSGQGDKVIIPITNFLPTSDDIVFRNSWMKEFYLKP